MRSESVAVGAESVMEHELTRVAAAHGLHLNATLTEMLNEHFSHRTGRRGCGYTQATRKALAGVANVHRAPENCAKASNPPTSMIA